MAPPIHILLLEDNPGDAFFVKTMLQKSMPGEFELVVTDRLEKARKIFADESAPDLVLMDLNLPDSSGTATFEAVLQSAPKVPIVVFTGLDEREISRGLLDKGAYAFMRKDEITESVLFNTVCSCLKRSWNENELMRHKAVAEASDAKKTTFLGQMSHELRTPLTAVLGFTEVLLSSENLSDEQFSQLTRVRSNAKHLQALVNDLLDLSKIEMGKLEVEAVPFPFSEFLDDVFSTLKVQAEKKQIGLSCTTQGTLPPVVETDRTRLRQILLNVIGNAVKFTDTGLVEVTIEATARNGNGAELNFRVKDKGPGITEAKADALFKPYELVHPNTEKRQGTGLGLALSRGFARVMKGDIKLESSTTTGSVFHIRMPVQTQEDVGWITYAWPNEHYPAPTSVGACEPLSGLKILVVEDVEDLRDLYKHVLNSNGAGTVDAVGTGKEAIRMALSREYDVVLLDLSLPDADGRDVTSQLRAKGYDRPIVALTAHALPEMKENALNAGFSHYLTKPVQFPKLTRVLHRLGSIKHH